MVDLPISAMTEQCIESGNKISKYTRLHHTRKISRLATMTDHFNRLLEISDPVMAIKMHNRRKARMRKEKPDLLPDDALPLLGLQASADLDESGIAE